MRWCQNLRIIGAVSHYLGVKNPTLVLLASSMAVAAMPDAAPKKLPMLFVEDGAGFHARSSGHTVVIGASGLPSGPLAVAR